MGAATLTINCLSKHFNTADEDMPLRTLEIAYDCGHSHDEISGFCCKLRGGGTREPRQQSQPFLAAIDKVRDFGSSDDDRHGVCLSALPWHSIDADMVSPSYRSDREVRIQWCCDELIREGQVDTACYERVRLSLVC